MPGEYDQVKELVEGINTGFHEFKSVTERKIAALEKGRGTAELDGILAKINEDMDAKGEKATKVATDLKERLDSLEAALKRPTTYVPDGKGGVKEIALETAEQKEHRKAVDSYVRSGNGVEQLRSLEQKALVRSIDPQGGYWAPDVQGGMIVKRTYDTSPVRQVAGGISISGPAYTFQADINAMTALWEGEVETPTETATPDIGGGRIVAHTLRARPQASQELLEDAQIDVETWLGDKAADAFTRTENTAFVVGDGVRRPRGFTTYTLVETADASRAWGQMEKLKSGTNGSFGTAPNGSDKLIALIHKGKVALRQGSIFVMNKTTLGAARQLKQAANGPYIWMPANDVSAVMESPILAAGGRLLGYPVLEAEDMPLYTTTGAAAIAFGNFREGYLVVDRLGISLLRDPFTAEPYVKFIFRKRVGGDVVNFEAIKFLTFEA